MRMKENRSGSDGPTEWTCSYCPSVATTLRKGSPVCYRHALPLSPSTGLAERILSKLREALRLKSGT